MANAEKERTIRIYGKEIVTSDGGKFIACSYKSGEEYLNVKFTKESNTTIGTRGYYKVTFNLDDANVGKDKKGFRTLWIKKVIKLERDLEYETEVAKRKAEELESIVDGLPF